MQHNSIMRLIRIIKRSIYLAVFTAFLYLTIHGTIKTKFLLQQWKQQHQLSDAEKPLVTDDKLENVARWYLRRNKLPNAVNLEKRITDKWKDKANEIDQFRQLRKDIIKGEKISHGLETKEAEPKARQDVLPHEVIEDRNSKDEPIIRGHLIREDYETASDADVVDDIIEETETKIPLPDPSNETRPNNPREPNVKTKVLKNIVLSPLVFINYTNKEAGANDIQNLGNKMPVKVKNEVATKKNETVRMYKWMSDKKEAMDDAVDGRIIINTDQLKQKAKKRKESENLDYKNLKKEEKEQPKNEIEKKNIPENVRNRTKESANPFNYKISDLLPVNRNLPDTRNKKCEGSWKTYGVPRDVKVTVVISYRNERRSALLRTIASVFRQTPSVLLDSIVVVDDASNDLNVRELEMKLPRLIFLRNKEHLGVAASRSKGADFSNSSHIVFLDSHCEVNRDWLPPLLLASLQTPQALVSPVLDVIDTFTLKYRPAKDEFRAGFTWNLDTVWLEREPAKDKTLPFTSPIVAGGMFLVSRSWWNNIRGYDPGMQGWGSEGLEISLKTWMCGGSVMIAPCSRVGHIFTRTAKEYKSTQLRNSRRVADVWLGPFAEFFFNARPRATYKEGGDISTQRQLTKDLGCKDFSWYLSTVYPKLLTPTRITARAGLLQQSHTCLFVITEEEQLKKPSQEPLESGDCSSSQTFEMSVDGFLTYQEWCLISNPPSDVRVMLVKCSGDKKMRWRYNDDDKRLVHVASSNCLDSAGLDIVMVMPCAQKSNTQTWDFINPNSVHTNKNMLLRKT